jgi:hypothetical protein
MHSTRPISSEGTWGNQSLETDEHIVLYFIGSIDPVNLPIAKRYILGRADESGEGSNSSSKVDLTHYGADHKGVSRAHAALHVTHTEVTLTDLGSTNGTYLNNQRLQPQESIQVRSGDQIRLGELIGYIYFSKGVLESVSHSDGAGFIGQDEM